MIRKENINFTPKDTFERLLLSAIDSGKLQNYLSENHNIMTRSILRRILEFILNLPPSKLLLANRQIRSRLVMRVAKTKEYELFDKIYHKKPVDLKKYYSHPELKK